MTTSTATTTATRTTTTTAVTKATPVLNRIIEATTTPAGNDSTVFVSPAESSIGFASVQSPTIRRLNAAATPAPGKMTLPVSIPRSPKTTRKASNKTTTSQYSSHTGTTASSPMIKRINTATTVSTNSYTSTTFINKTHYQDDHDAKEKKQYDNPEDYHATGDDGTNSSFVSSTTNSTATKTSPGSLCRQFLVNATRHEQCSLLSFLSLVQAVNPKAYYALIAMCQKYHPDDSEVILHGLQTVATVVSFYTSTWFVTSVNIVDNKLTELQNSRSTEDTYDDEQDGPVDCLDSDHKATNLHNAEYNNQNSNRSKQTDQYHDRTDELASRIVDFFLVSHRLMPVYFAAALFCTKYEQRQMDQHQYDLYYDPEDDHNGYYSMDTVHPNGLRDEVHTWFQFHDNNNVFHCNTSVSAIVATMTQVVEQVIRTSISFM